MAGVKRRSVAKKTETTRPSVRRVVKKSAAATKAEDLLSEEEVVETDATEETVGEEELELDGADDTGEEETGEEETGEEELDGADEEEAGDDAGEEELDDADEEETGEEEEVQKPVKRRTVKRSGAADKKTSTDAKKTGTAAKKTGTATAAKKTGTAAAAKKAGTTTKKAGTAAKKTGTAAKKAGTAAKKAGTAGMTKKKSSAPEESKIPTFGKTAANSPELTEFIVKDNVLSVPNIQIPDEVGKRFKRSDAVKIFNSLVRERLDIAFENITQAKNVFECCEDTIEQIIEKYGIKFAGAYFRVSNTEERYYKPLLSTMGSLIPEHLKVTFNKRINCGETRKGVMLENEDNEIEFFVEEEIDAETLEMLEEELEERRKNM